MILFLISLISISNYCILVVISSFLQVSHGVPDDYCLAPLNKSDCGQAVTAVFTYWLPGSRCEIEFWRGCPTTNKFPNEYVCSHYCIGTLFRSDVIDYELGPLKKPEGNVCDEEFDDDDCKGEPTHVYTYNKTLEMCIEATWLGCETRNRFEDAEDCIKTCQGDITQDLGKLKTNEIEQINDLLDTADEQTTEDDSETTITTDETTTEGTTTEGATEEITTEAETTPETGDPDEVMTT